MYSHVCLFCIWVLGCVSRWSSASGLGGVSVWDVLELRLSRQPMLVHTTVAAALREDILSTQIKDITNVRMSHKHFICKTSTLNVFTFLSMLHLFKVIHFSLGYLWICRIWNTLKQKWKTWISINFEISFCSEPKCDWMICYAQTLSMMTYWVKKN